MGDFKFYMMRYDGNTTSVWKDLEADFPGLRYKECKGLNAYGEPKNVYSEDFAETSKADVYVAGTPAYKQTTIKLTLVFLEDGNTGYSAYDDFLSFVSGCRLAYRDTARRRSVMMYLTGASEPSGDTLKGKNYKEVTFTFTNVYGCSFGYDESFPTE